MVSSSDSTVVAVCPLCVDLDGTLVKSDTLVDSLLALLRSRPALVLALPRCLLRGKAAFKKFVADSVSLDVAHLPYNQQLLQFLRQEHSRGRAILLATGADAALASRVADHLGIFSGVLSSDGATNMIGNRKLLNLRSRIGEAEFDYIGNDTPDLPLLVQAREPMLANPGLLLKMKLRARGIKPIRQFDDRKNFASSLLKAMRPHQWAKNLLIFLPLLLSHSIAAKGLLSALLAFACFSLTASATYIVNDLLDIESDRRHTRKCMRPFAAGDLSAFAGVRLATCLLLLALVIASVLPISFSAWLLLYLGVTLAYSSYLKRVPLVDVLVLSGLYTLRLLAGSTATGTHISHWLGSFSIFLFFSLAVAKRFTELENLSAAGMSPKNGRGYVLADINQLRSFGTSSAFAAVVIFSIYISGSDVTQLYRNPTLLWLIMPLMILWLSRVWLLASRGELHQDPVVFALTDRMSLLIGVAVAVIAVFAV